MSSSSGTPVNRSDFLRLILKSHRSNFPRPFLASASLPITLSAILFPPSPHSSRSSSFGGGEVLREKKKTQVPSRAIPPRAWMPDFEPFFRLLPLTSIAFRRRGDRPLDFVDFVVVVEIRRIQRRCGLRFRRAPQRENIFAPPLVLNSSVHLVRFARIIIIKLKMSPSSLAKER